MKNTSWLLLSRRMIVATFVALALVSSGALTLASLGAGEDSSSPKVIDPVGEMAIATDKAPEVVPAEKVEEPSAPREVDPNSDIISAGTYAFTFSSGNALEDMS